MYIICRYYLRYLCSWCDLALSRALLRSIEPELVQFLNPCGSEYWTSIITIYEMEYVNLFTRRYILARSTSFVRSVSQTTHSDYKKAYLLNFIFRDICISRIFICSYSFKNIKIYITQDIRYLLRYKEVIRRNKTN